MSAHGLALVPPGPGRQFAASRVVRLGDVLPSGEARLDAIARYLQDIAADDGRDAAIDNYLAWLVRKTILGVVRRPRLGERIELVTWASGSGARWAERRTTISVDGQPVVDAASLWVCVDVVTMRATRIPARFWEVYREAVGDRTVSPRLVQPDVATVGSEGGRPWPLRISDLDILGHVNNAVTWAAIEDELSRLGVSSRVTTADLEYRGPIDASHDLTIVSAVEGATAAVWLTAADPAPADDSAAAAGSNRAVLASAALTLR